MAISARGKKVLFLFFGCIGICCLFLFRSQEYIMNNISLDTSPFFVSIKQEKTKAKTEACTFPDIDPFDPLIMKYIKKYPTISCHRGLPSFVYLDGFSLKINITKFKEKSKNSNRTLNGCTFKRLTMLANTDKKAQAGNASILFKDSINLTKADDNLFIECFDNNNSLLTKQYMYVVHENERVEARSESIYKLHQENYKPKETLSVFMIGQDGMSKHAFERSMPKTRDFILKQMEGLELYKYNMVGHNTFPNVVPLMTGRSAEEISGEWSKRDPLDVINYAFIWNDFRLAGYRTAAMIGDAAAITAWHFNVPGWHQPYVDYNSRAMVVASDVDTEIRNYDGTCVGDVPEIDLHFNQWRQFTKMYHTPDKPYFGYNFLSKLTHDDMNRGSEADDLYLDFFSELHESHVLNNTLVIWFSDHGERYGGIRGTYNGLIEGKLPHMFLIFPSWFYKKYPEVYKILKINQHRLTSAFDIYATMKDIIIFDGTTGKGDISKRGISLFNEIPVERTCELAGIPAEYCACVSLVKANISSLTAGRLSDALIAQIRKLGNETLCHKLHVDKVITLLENNDKNVNTFQMTIETKPGGALYEAKLNLTEAMEVEVIGRISRINRYHGTAECVDDSSKFPYCYCKHKPDAERMKKFEKARR